GSTQCLHVSASGVVSGTSSDCGSATGVTSVTASFPVVSSGGTTPNITYIGLSTTSPWTNGNLAWVQSGNTVSSVATSTLFGASTNGFILAMVSGSLQMVATSSINNGVISVSCTTITCSGTNPASFS